MTALGISSHVYIADYDFHKYFSPVTCVLNILICNLVPNWRADVGRQLSVWIAMYIIYGLCFQNRPHQKLAEVVS